jgi:hypothetical protein
VAAAAVRIFLLVLNNRDGLFSHWLTLTYHRFAKNHPISNCKKDLESPECVLGRGAIRSWLHGKGKPGSVSAGPCVDFRRSTHGPALGASSAVLEVIIPAPVMFDSREAERTFRASF